MSQIINQTREEKITNAIKSLNLNPSNPQIVEEKLLNAFETIIKNLDILFSSSKNVNFDLKLLSDTKSNSVVKLSDCLGIDKSVKPNNYDNDLNKIIDDVIDYLLKNDFSYYFEKFASTKVDINNDEVIERLYIDEDFRKLCILKVPIYLTKSLIVKTPKV